MEKAFLNTIIIISRNNSFWSTQEERTLDNHNLPVDGTKIPQKGETNLRETYLPPRVSTDFYPGGKGIIALWMG